MSAEIRDIWAKTPHIVKVKSKKSQISTAALLFVASESGYSRLSLLQEDARNPLGDAKPKKNSQTLVQDAQTEVFDN